MKTKRIKRTIAGLLAFAVMFVSGSFGNVKNAKADTHPTFEQFSMNITVLVPKKAADLSAQSKEKLSASNTGTFNKIVNFGNTGTMVKAADVTPLENYDNKYNGYRIELIVRGMPESIQLYAVKHIKKTYFSGKLICEDGQFVNMFTPKAGYKETYTTDVITKENSNAVSFLTDCASYRSKAKNPEVLDFTVNAITDDIACDFELKDSMKATCTEDSTEHLECKYCGLTKTTHNTKATGHSYTLMDVKADALYQPATCVTAPKYYYSCANCGKVEGDANHVFSNGDALGHDYQTVYEDNNGIHNGKESKVCSRCHDEKDVKYLLYIDPLDAIKNDVAFTSGFGYYSNGQQVQVQGLANVNKTIGYGTPYYVYNDKKLDISTGIITMPDHAISVSLMADLEIYNLNFVVPHGWMTVPTQNFKYGEGVSTLAMPAMDTGYQFLGWYDNKDCTGEPVTSVAATEHADKTLYGKTEVITYNIDYEFGGTKGIGIDSIKVDDSAVKSYNIESDSIKLPTAEDIEVVGDVATDKVEFKGWYSDEDMTEPVTEIKTGSIGNKTVYAKYSMKAAAPTTEPTETPSATPSTKPSQTPSSMPTVKPSQMPSGMPTVKPSQIPSAKPSVSPSVEPSAIPSVTPSIETTNTPSVVPTTVPTTKPNQSFVTPKPVVNTTVVTKGGITYKVKGKSCVVIKSNKKIKKAVIQKKVKFVINGKTVAYKVTGIEKNVFKNCKKLKFLTIKSTTIKKIAKNAFKGVSKKCKVKVPKKQFKKYQKLFKKTKFKGKVKK